MLKEVRRLVKKGVIKMFFQSFRTRSVQLDIISTLTNIAPNA